MFIRWMPRELWLQIGKVINFLCSFPPSTIGIARFPHSLRRKLCTGMNAGNVSIPKTNSRMMRQHFHSDEPTHTHPHPPPPGPNDRVSFHENYAMHVFNRNKNNYIFVVSTMIRCVNTRFVALAWALMRFDFSFWIARRRTLHHRIQMEAKKKNSHFFLSFGAFDVRLLIHLQFRQRTVRQQRIIA